MPVGKSGRARSTTHCVDAGIVVRAVVTTGHPAVRQVWRDFAAAGADLVAPLLLRYEVTNVVHRLRRAGEVDEETAAKALDRMLNLPIDCYDDLDLYGRAVDLAAKFSLPASYDAHYLALAERLGVDLWTTDRRLAAAVGGQLSWVRLVA